MDLGGMSWRFGDYLIKSCENKIKMRLNMYQELFHETSTNDLTPKQKAEGKFRRLKEDLKSTPLYFDVESLEVYFEQSGIKHFVEFAKDNDGSQIVQLYRTEGVPSEEAVTISIPEGISKISSHF